MMRTLQTLGQPDYSSVLPINSGPVLPPEPNSQPMTQGGAAPQPLVRPIDPPLQPPAPPAPAPATPSRATPDNGMQDEFRREMP
ncbi:MAG: hypothetical protein GAK30_03462 [Paracidovorax wautersii]|uniref:Uncharacterized protein n=1 Tax=Paracidovorax wautersii TaxID=1177982 RepID=A0A7V8JNS9_9BURK|nr:MAG: hypothetical protein GAK30_03462 [Paracidovorax wautersii]